MMNKNRIEALSDGVFAIVMTILIIEIKVPSLAHTANEYNLMEELWDMWPLFRSYYISFAVLGMYWISHHAMFHLIIKHVSRNVTHLNILFLCFLSLIPFSTHLIGRYPLNAVAVAIYGFNVIAIGFVQYAMFRSTLVDPKMIHEGVTPQLIMHSKVQMLLPPVFAVLGIIAGFFHSTISFFLFAFPIVFNIIPSSLNFVENIFLKKK